MSQPARAVWIEILGGSVSSQNFPSQPARAVWIEISSISPSNALGGVTACEGCVD